MPWYLHESSPRPFFVAEESVEKFESTLEGSDCTRVTKPIKSIQGGGIMPLNVKIPKSAFAKGRERFAETGIGGGQSDDIELAPGRHVAILQRIDTAEAGGEPKAILRFKVAGDSEQAGGTVSVWYTMDEDRIEWLFKALAKLGYDVSEMDDKLLAEYIDDVAKSKHVCKITSKHADGYINIYFDKKLEDLTAADVGGEDSKDETNSSGAKGLSKAAPAAAKTPAKKPVESKKAPPAEEPETLDELDALDRAELKEILEAEEIEFSVKKATTEDEIRVAIRAAREEKASAGDGEAPAAAESSNGDVSIEVGMAVKFTVKGKKLDGKVVAIDETSGVVKVKAKDGTLHKVTDLETLELA